ncbi:MAG: hypothetical protein P9C48_07480 [Defluviicoccus sp.]|nr:hypothetical protein [Defluviicoccus sp.]MDG4608953.1 hypothetical protein [Defluviicoccus sp.]
MTLDRRANLRQSVIAAIVRRRAGLGRTAIMKLAYFLQTLRGIPLGYSFRIYTYGPYDGQVLDDLQAVESLGAVSSQYYEYQYGTGYLIFASDKAGEIAQQADKEYGQDLDEVVAQFGDRGAVELETASTIVFVDRQTAKGGQRQTADDLANAVHEIKPHLDIQRILDEVGRLKAKGWLQAVH